MKSYVKITALGLLSKTSPAINKKNTSIPTPQGPLRWVATPSNDVTTT